MSDAKTLLMLAALATVLGAGTACFRLFAGSSEPAREAEIEECAGLSGQARTDCEARHRKP
jgi:uncharacterized membrane protein